MVRGRPKRVLLSDFQDGIGRVPPGVHLQVWRERCIFDTVKQEIVAFIFLGVGALLILLEFGFPTQFDLFALGAGSFLTGLLLLLGLPLSISVLSGLALAFIVVLASRRWLRRIPTENRFTPEGLVGLEGEVIHVEGKKFVVRVQGEDWLAIPDRPLRVGDRVRVVAVEGNRLRVTSGGEP